MFSQGVKWIVMNEPSYMGRQQIEEYRRAVGMYDGSKVRRGKSRPVSLCDAAADDLELARFLRSLPACEMVH